MPGYGPRDFGSNTKSPVSLDRSKQDRIAVLGSGGREHALAWRLEKDRPGKVVLYPGNAATAAFYPGLGEVSLENVELLAQALRDARVGLVVIGPEVLLASGLADALRKAGFDVVGPGADAARLETSKVFAKEFMQAAKIPTAPFQIVHNIESLLGALREFPVALKFDGLAAGKGVVIAQNRSEAEAFGKRIWSDREFGQETTAVVVESFLQGKEVSWIGLCDGETFCGLPTATDYKRLEDGDQGPNTGGMGAVSPSPYWNESLERITRETIVAPLLRQLKRQGLPYRGALYLGLMICEQRPYVLEFNTRFGDPETQCLMLRLAGNFAEALEATATGSLSKLFQESLPATKGAAVYVVGAAEGYPAKPQVGDPIEGLDRVEKNARVFFSGIKKSEGLLSTGGGRVLGIGAQAESVALAREQVYRQWDQIRWRGRQLRSDIGT